MPVRRVLLLFAGLLALAALASAVAPREPIVREDPRDVAPPAAEAPGVVRGRLPADRTVRATVGDVVELVVAVEAPDEVEIDAFGLDAPADQDSPARFTFIADRAGRYPVRLRFADRRVGVLEVEDAS